MEAQKNPEYAVHDATPGLKGLELIIDRSDRSIITGGNAGCNCSMSAR
jgi:hypothetical protein